ncbi:MAG: VIT domain-containing protein [Elusimicrobiales bacterium]|nr:VIT domain-containing protein [Elusimicrobiales bacterium]
MKLISQFRKVLAPVIVLALSCAASARPQDPGEGCLQVVSAGTDTLRILPLKHTEVKAAISGFVAEVSVTQVFGNPSEDPIEAVYVFPLPENAAVNEMTLAVGDRLIKGQIKKREEARQVYEKAKAEGRTAALLDQERPNIFTQSVANIPPGREIRVTLKYIQDLAYDHGEYKFVFPMTVGPRYIPGKTTGKAGTGWSDDTDQVRDASRISPPVVKPGQRSGRDISVQVSLDAGVAVRNLRSSSHAVTINSIAPAKAEITISPEDSIPNKDFLLTYEPAVKMVSAAVLAHKEGKEGYLTLMVQPNADFPLTQVTPKELVIAIDVSGSMSGFPLQTAKETALRCLDGMNPGDTFQIMSFASGNELHFERPLENTPLNVARGRAVINGLSEGGGTEMLAALQKVLEFRKDPERLRIVLFMTDGFIGNDPEILAFTKEHLNNSRIFPLGVGSSTNRYLLEEMAVLGKGTVQYVRYNEKAEKLEKVIERFYERISRPVLTDLSVDWNGLDVADLSPSFIPDLFAGQPLLLHARYNKGGSAPVLIRGKLMGKPWKMSVSVNLPEKEMANGAMGTLWARSSITDLERLNLRGENADAKARIIELALAHKLVTGYTSFVAVDESPVDPKGKKPLLIPVESELPEGTQYEGFFGRAGGGGSLSGASFGAAAVRGSFGQAKYARMASPASSAMLSMESADGASSLHEAKAAGSGNRVKALPEREDIVAGLALKLLENPTPRLLRQLVSRQEASGSFSGSEGRKTSPADQALALLALAKAKTVLEGDADAAIQLAWSSLRRAYPAGTNGREAVVKALKGSPHWSSVSVQRELAALGATLEALK